MPFCPSCGHEHAAGARFCGQCGGALAGSSPDAGATVLGGAPPDAGATRLGGTAPGGVTPAVRGGATPAGGPTAPGPPPTPGGAPGAAGPLSPGQAFGPRYHIIKLLGVGGMGAVYQAWDAELNVAVALKVIKPDVVADPDAARDIERRFKRELLLARQVTHKNVVRIHDLGELDGIKYITMPYVEGSDLAQVLAEAGTLPVPRVVSIAKQVAAGLVAAHEVGVVHRDLKPANVMIAEDRALIMDFGIARSVEPGATMATMAGAVVGTVEYMAPEQARGETVDQRADIYAFGLIVYDMLLGARRGSSATNPVSELMARITKGLPPPRSVDPQVPEGIDQVVARCLQPDPAARYQTSAELAADLERLGPDGMPVVALPARAKKLSLPLVAAGAVLILALLSVTWWRGSRTSAPAEVAAHEPVSALVTNFVNQTGDPVFEGSLEQALALGLEGAPFLTTYPRRDALRVAEQIRAGASLDEEMGRLVSAREGIRIILAGSIAPEGSGYALSVKAIDAQGNTTIDTVDEKASSKAAVLETVGDIAVKIRRALGDTAPEASGSRETVTAGSLEAMQAYLSAQDLARAGNDEQAIASYQEALQRDPNLGRAYSGLATSLFRLGRRAEAEEAWKKALGLMDRMTDREKYRTLGTYYIAVERNYEQAIENYSALVKQYPADTTGHNNLAVALFSSLRFAEAMEEGRRALEIFPKSVLYRTNYALYAMYAGDFDTAADEAAKVAAQSPETYKAYLPSATAAMVAGRFDEARAAYDRMAGAGPRGASLANLGRADLAIYEGRLDDAVTELQAGITADEQQQNVSAQAVKLIALAQALDAKGETRAALDAVSRALELSSREAIVVPAAVLYARAGQRDRAKALADRLAGRLQPMSRAYAAIIEGQIALAGKNWVGAYDAFRSAIQLADLWYAHFGLAVAYIENGSFVEGLAEIETCEKRRGEAVALFLDDYPTYRYLAPLPDWKARARAGFGG